MELPSQRILAAAAATQSVVDANGRTLTVRRLTALDKLRVIKAAGPQLAQNQAWMGLALLAASVVEIDNVPVPIPVSEAQIEGVIDRLGDDGVAAVADAALAALDTGHDMAAVLGN